MSTFRHHHVRRTLVGLSVSAVGLGLLSMPPAAAEPAPDERSLIGSVTSGRIGGPDVARQSAPKAPASSSRDFADGATHRSARLAAVSVPAPAGQQQIVRADVSQDLVGQRLRATVALTADDAAADPLVVVYFGEVAGGSCESRVAIAARARAAESLGQFADNSAFAVTRTRSGNVLTLVSQARSTFRTAEYDCAFAAIPHHSNPQGQPNQVMQAQYLTTHFTPKLAITGAGESLQAARQGRWVSMRLEVRNSGRGTAANTRVTLAGKGLKISPRSRTVGTIKGRSTAYGQTFKVRVAKGTKARRLTVTATANGVRTARAFTIGVAPKPAKPRSLSGRYYWGFATTSAADSQGWDTQVIWFLNKRWAHIGAPRNGVVPKCRRATKACKKYTYNRRTGVVRMAGRKAKVTTYGFTYTAPKDKRRFYEPVTFPKKNQRFATSLINNDWSGNCLLTCTATVSNLTLDRRGRFLRGSFSVGSWPGLGSSWASIPPDQRGSYRVISRGRVELRYANGKVERTRMALSHNALNRPSASSGIILGTKNYYHDD